MHLARIAVSHWRRHDHLVIDELSDRINLICGPNEAGKSTIAEALRFALFEPCRPAYLGRKAIQQRSSTEPPTVEVDFVVEGQRWRIEKRFLRRQHSRLTGPDGTAVEGDPAERALQDLLGYAAPNAGRATRDVEPEHLGLWPILWQHQGALSGLDQAVTDGVRSRLSALVSLEVGAVAAGPLATKVLELVQGEHDRFWTAVAGKPTGDHGKAIKDRETALVRRDQARSRLKTFEDAVRDLQDLTERMAGLTPRLRLAEEQAEVARMRARLAGERQQALDQHRVELNELRRAAGESAKALVRRAELESELIRYRTELDHHAGRAAGVAGELERLEQAQVRLEIDASHAQQQAVLAQDLADQAQDRAGRARLAEQVAQAAARLLRIDALVEVRRQAQAAVAAMSGFVTPRALAVLRDQVAAYRHACGQRDVAATTISFQSEQAQTATWTADGQVSQLDLVAAGLWTGSAANHGELHLPGVGTIRVRTGGSGSGDLALAARQAGTALEEHLRRLKVASLEEAEGQFQRHADAVTACNQASAALLAGLGLSASAGAAEVAQAVEDLRHEVAAGQARLAAGSAEDAAAGGLDPEAARTAARGARELAVAAGAAAEDLRKHHRTLRDRLAEIKAEIAVGHDRVQRTSAELAQLPDQSDLSRRQADAVRLLGEAVNREADLLAAWNALGGSAAAEEADALAGAAKRLQDEAQSARQGRDQLHGVLRATSEQDPAAELQEAEAELEQATVRAAAIQRQARAVQLLRETMLTVQRETRAVLAAPVRAAIEPYLRRIFPRAKLLLGDDDWRLTGLAAGDTTEPFDQLSLGAREQFALLVRLGLAEVFAKGRRLPLVLDDPLINADPQRRGTMIQALRHASRKLQILVFTCHEAEHDALAAEKVVVLPAARS
ncbi:GTP-binding protein [Planctomycetota bacterium]|nr:GTP-binding protein [Planctomycetota bacterium]